MSFTLLIFYEWKPGISAQRIEHHFTKIRALPQSVPGMIDVRVGPSTISFGPDAQRWTHAGIMTFNKQSDYESFGRSAAHDEIAPQLVADLENLLAVGMQSSG